VPELRDSLLLTREEFSKVTKLSVDAEYMYDAALPELKAQVEKCLIQQSQKEK
jgi:hypothetical protein